MEQVNESSPAAPAGPLAEAAATSGNGAYADNPPLVRLWRGDRVECVHRGAWVLADSAGNIVASAGDHAHPIYARSSVKSLQALPLIETGAASRFGFSDPELALAVASHSAEACHTDAVEALLGRLELSVDDLLCGAHPPTDPQARALLASRALEPTALHNNCSGKHTGFLALALHLGVAPADYLDPMSESQRRVRAAVLEMSGVGEDDLGMALDGCNAPTWRLPLHGLATAFARVANPEGLSAERRDACERITNSVAANPVLIAGTRRRICTDIARLAGGRLFPKGGAEGVYAVGLRGGDLGLALKIDDGSTRGVNALIRDLLRRFDFATEEELAPLDSWSGSPLQNWAGVDVGRTEIVE
ncbi:MAG: asparaginase [Planctomycetota bacterium]|jgi:L-asparaginase II|nr:L-asparaginase [Planctomycetota bacterium]MDP6368310.1 asparaginase [Planctomycetota bacterium]